MGMLIFLVIIGAVLFFLKNLKNEQGSKGNRTPITGKRPLTMNEQPMFIRLIESLPEYGVLAQVAFSSFMTAKGYATRNLFNRKVADFVVIDKNFNVVAIVELDDSSHKGRENNDANRDALVNEAGFRVIRYNRTPEKSQIRSDFGLL
ncbi:DUF2726 domain-containing protein [Acinetobacter sp. MD2(2019)]|nr:DUF2726 domain-containing protein [Acinetobacter sp. MD2(2019)]